MSLAERQNVEPIKRRSIAEIAIERILELIQQQGLKEGDRLPTEKELAETLAISRSTLRESIRVLDMMGIIKVEHGSGMVIHTSKLSDSILKPLRFSLMLHKHRLLELFETRRLIEVECTGLAANRATVEEVGRIRAIYERLLSCVDDRDQGISCEIELHEQINRSAHNAILYEVLLSVKNLLKVSRDVTVPANGVSPATIESHGKILEAIEARDALKARQEMLRHLDEVYERYKNLQ